MDTQLSFVLNLSLEEMALRRLAVNLWSDTDTLSFSKVSDSRPFCENEWKATVESEIEGKVSKLVLPKSLKNRLEDALRHIGVEMFKWIFHFVRIFSTQFLRHFAVAILEQLYWTSAGDIDPQKTAENLISLDFLSIAVKYRLACEYCLVDSIPLLWEKLPESNKRRFDKELHVFEKNGRILEFYWSCLLKGKEPKLDSFYDSTCSFNKIAFESSASAGNKAATKYFFQKLTNEERDSCLFNAISSATEASGRFLELPNKMPEVVRYLLCQMSPTQQVEALKEHNHSILRYFFKWPLQELFLDIADKISTFLTEISYFDLLCHCRYSIYYFPILTQKCFLRTSNFFRKQFIRQIGIGVWVTGYIELIQVLFTNVDLGDRTDLLSGDWFSELIKDLMKKGRWHIAEKCLQYISLSKEEKKRLKEIFWGCLDITERTQCQIWERLFEFLDETDVSARRKAHDEEALPKVKKLCTEEKNNDLS